MPTLISEAEQRFLGAMLADRDLDPEGVLKAEEFSEPAHGRVYDAIHRARAEAESDGEDLAARVVKLAAVPGIDQPVLESMRARAPEASHDVLVYAQMIGTASTCRELLAFTESWSKPDADPHDVRANAAMQRQSLSHLELFNTEIDAVASEPLPEQSERVELEERLVASLMADPGQVQTLVGITPPETLQDARANAAYEIIAEGVEAGSPVSDLELIYKLGQRHLDPESLGWEVENYGETDAAFVRRLSEMPTTPGTGIEAARALLTMDVRNSVTPQAAPSPEIEFPPHPTIDFGPEPPIHRPGLGGGLQ